MTCARFCPPAHDLRTTCAMPARGPKPSPNLYTTTEGARQIKRDFEKHINWYSTSVGRQAAPPDGPHECVEGLKGGIQHRPVGSLLHCQW